MALLSGIAGAIGGLIVGALAGDTAIMMSCAAGGFVGGIFAWRKYCQRVRH